VKTHRSLCLAALATIFATATMLAATPTPNPTPGPLGVVEGKLTLGTQRGVDLADDVPALNDSAPDVGEHTLVIRSAAGAADLKEIKTDQKGNYRVALPPGEYVVELKPTSPREASPRATTTQRFFTVTANETVQVDMQVGANIRQMQ
jgi:hypothetical protein